ncbi:hypothetical protein ACRALDRAFT_211774 [Sodiomyces alcalophilus JCM 7366]|uniref:uncharacterized protein n=1 Tax=Sodiomyces alcalophilus JCM 7366 TaxID=591952 RepID=UPI0039B3BE7B
MSSTLILTISFFFVANDPRDFGIPPLAATNAIFGSFFPSLFLVCFHPAYEKSGIATAAVICLTSRLSAWLDAEDIPTPEPLLTVPYVVLWWFLYVKGQGEVLHLCRLTHPYPNRDRSVADLALVIYSSVEFTRVGDSSQPESSLAVTTTYPAKRKKNSYSYKNTQKKMVMSDKTLLLYRSHE